MLHNDVWTDMHDPSPIQPANPSIDCGMLTVVDAQATHAAASRHTNTNTHCTIF
jgi:hypothetical protein